MAWNRIALAAALALALTPSTRLDAASSLIKAPGAWETQGAGKFASHDGFAWYRCFVKVPDRWVSAGTRNLWVESVTLKVEKISDAHELYINGTKIDGAGSFPPNFKSGLNAVTRYKIPGGILKKGEYNCVAFRVYDNGGEGGFVGDAPVISGYFLECVLAGDWEFQTGDDAAFALGASKEKPAQAAYDEFRDAVTAIERPDKLLSGTGISPAESLKKTKVFDDLEVAIVLAEPLIAQPLQMSWDERGRLWVVEYRQYPFPAGLKMLSRDKYYRATYDKIPPAPPNHDRGRDRISIHEDTNGDGDYDKHSVFVDGLNITTSIAHGRGGKWIMNPPYLLFYPDRDGDDVPDSDPIVHLAGFGLEDTHSVANSLRWGPDGWLYGAHGSTTSSQVRRPGVTDKPIYMEGAAIWRYHPETHKLQVFAEGGGNAFSVEFDAKGRVFSGYNGGNTRGFHYWHGGYYNKGNLAKYGPVSNPHSFGELPWIAHDKVPRFTHTFLVYEGGALSQKYHGKMFCGDPLHRNIVLTDRFPDGSTLKTEDLGFVLESEDTAFRPIDIKTGPDGAVYISDWTEELIAHGQHFQGQIDPTNGRIYRIREKGVSAIKPFNLAAKSTDELIDTLTHENKWFRQEALRLLADRSDRSALPRLKKLALGNDNQLALEALWAFNVSGGFNDQQAGELLYSKDDHVRGWVIRLACDDGLLDEALAANIAILAAGEPSAIVRAQMAVSARQLPPALALPIIRELLEHDIDADDPHIPLLLWWALEASYGGNRDEIVKWFEEPSFWNKRLAKEHILSRLMRRAAIAEKRQDLLACARLLNFAPTKSDAETLMAGFELAFKGRTLPPLPDELSEAMAKVGAESLALKIRRGDAAAIGQALDILANPKADLSKRLLYTQTFGEISQSKSIPTLLKLAADAAKTPDLQKAALTSLQRYNQPDIGARIVELYSDFEDGVLPAAQTLLASRAAWSRQLVKAIDAGKIDKRTLPTDIVDRLRASSDSETTALIKRHFGDKRVTTSKEMQDEIQRLSKVIDEKPGNIYEGEKHFQMLCAPCHKLFRNGGQIGPDLTSYQRDDLSTMLVSIVNPNAEVREGFENYSIKTKDERSLTGFLVDQDAKVVVLRGLDGQNISLQRSEIKEMRPAGQSLMPAGLLGSFNDQQIRDLFAYLRTGQPISR